MMNKLVKWTLACSFAAISTSSALSAQDLNKVESVFDIYLNDSGSVLFSFRQFEGERNLYAMDVPSGTERAIEVPPLRNVFLVGPVADSSEFAYMHDGVGDELYKFTTTDLETGENTVITPEGFVDSPCHISDDGQHYYAARGTHIWGPKSLIRVEIATGNEEVLYAEEGVWLNCLTVSETDRILVANRFFGNTYRPVFTLDLTTLAPTTLFDIEGTYARDDIKIIDGEIIFAANIENSDHEMYAATGPDNIRRLNLDVGGNIQEVDFNKAGDILVTYRGTFHDKIALFERENGTWIESALNATLDPYYSGVLAGGTNTSIVAQIEGGPPSQMFHIDGMGNETLVLDTNRTGVPADQFATPDSLFVESFDGVNVPVHIYRPQDASKENPAPMVVIIHGGPQEHDDPKYSVFVQEMVLAGFVVVDPNVRGSTGFGTEYQLLDNGDWGGGHIRDANAVADYVQSLNYVRDDVAFLMGGSFGGFSVLSNITQNPDRYTAAIDFFGMTDLISFVDGLGEGAAADFFISEIGFDPRLPENRERAEEISPLFHAENIATPLMIHQGIHDPRVPKAQSDQLVERIESNAGEVIYHLYDEGHGFSNPQNEANFVMRSIAFMNSFR